MIVKKEGLETIRPGRNLHCRRQHLGSSKPLANLVFVHGTCASSAQYDRLLEALDDGSISCNCFLYDAIGCGKSPIDQEWKAYHTDESVKDLEAILDDEKSLPTILIGHSYAPTIFMRYLHRKQSNNNIKGCILLSTAIHGGPLRVPDGGHPVFRLPVFILECVQPSLTKSFLQLAYHPNCDPALLEAAKDANNSNSMFVAKAYHRHHQFATVEEAKALQHLPVLILHGQDDGIVPVEGGGQHVADVVQTNCVVISGASHQVMEERPKEVAEAMSRFLSNLLLK
jgi:pimeloyl-ACP methyl ester carboxylesterase